MSEDDAKARRFELARVKSTSQAETVAAVIVSQPDSNDPDGKSESSNNMVETRGESEIGEVMWNMINTIVGAGIVGTPAIYSQAGIVVGILMIIIFALIIRYALNLMINASKLGKVSNYEELMFLTFGKIGYMSILFALFVYDFGAMLSYVIILGDASSEALCEIANEKESYCDITARRLCTLVLGILLMGPWVLFRDISKIEKVSAVNVITVILIIIVVIYEYIKLDLIDNSSLLDGREYIYAPQGFWDAWSVVGIIAFIFVNHDSGFLLFNTLKNATQKRWNILTFVSFMAAVVIIGLFSIIGYITFGQNIQDNILNNYGTKADVVITITRIVFVFTAALTFPTYFYVVRHVSHSLYHALTVGVSKNENGTVKIPTIHDVSLTKHLIFTIPVFGINLILGLFITDLGFVMNVTGSLSAVFIAFILPPICYIKLDNTDNGSYFKQKYISPICLLILGVIIAIFSTIISILESYVWE